MEEEIYNLFIFFEDDIMKYLGCSPHIVNFDSDIEKEQYLLKNYLSDYKKCKKFKLPNEYIGKSIEKYSSDARIGFQNIIFSEIFAYYKTLEKPLYCITMIVNGVPKIDLTKDQKPFYLGEYQNTEFTGDGIMVDYLEAYTNDGKLNMKQLIVDDYFGAIQYLISNRFLVSSLKLLVSCIDTVGYFEFGNNGNVFIKWLDTYFDFKEENYNPAELWEFRNSILHMSNLDSKKHLKGMVDRITFFISDKHRDWNPKYDIKLKNINLNNFMKKFEIAIDSWILTYSYDVHKLSEFVSRYDKILSDCRPAIIDDTDEQ